MLLEDLFPGLVDDNGGIVAVGDHAERIAAACALDFWPGGVWRQRSELRAQRGVGIAAAYFAHSCRPNCVVTTVGALIIVQTIDNVVAGVELCVARCRIDAPLAEALAALARPQCVCARCVAEAADTQCEGLMRRFDEVRAKIEANSADLTAEQALAMANAVLESPTARDNTMAYLLSASFARERNHLRVARDAVVRALDPENAVDVATFLDELERAYSTDKEMLNKWIRSIVPDPRIVQLL
jgi:hypothetical protein